LAHIAPASRESASVSADTAMYHAKEHGRNNFQFFEAQMNLKAAERQSLESSLRLALERGEFLLHYQPKVNLGTGEITGVNTLAAAGLRTSSLHPSSYPLPKTAASFYL
jgi:predicted signal transduction protein with EAL and GGDEF domain